MLRDVYKILFRVEYREFASLDYCETLAEARAMCDDVQCSAMQCARIVAEHRDGRDAITYERDVTRCATYDASRDVCA